MEPMHFLRPYYRPRYMGGDTQHALCRAPRFGWAGDDAAALPMTPDRGAVQCTVCLRLLAKQPRKVADEPVGIRPRPNSDAKHLRLVWEASAGRMFPIAPIEYRRAA